MKTVPFVKATAFGNDFLLIDMAYAPADLAQFSRQICDRHNGVGADGVEWLSAVAEADIRAHLLNADGSEAELSGNGTRCVAAYVASKRGNEDVSVLTGAGVKTCRFIQRKGTTFEFETAMGVPEVGKPFSVSVNSKDVIGVPVSIGNPHFVVFVKGFGFNWQMQAAEIGASGVFKNGVNVEYVSVQDNANIEVLFFERGAGETKSSGTGSCASAAATIATKRGLSPLRVHAPGGTQTVRWENEIFLRGSAQLLCRGEFFI